MYSIIIYKSEFFLEKKSPKTCRFAKVFIFDSKIFKNHCQIACPGLPNGLLCAAPEQKEAKLLSFILPTSEICQFFFFLAESITSASKKN